MKVDIHTHTEAYTAGSSIPPVELILMAEASSYDTIFLAERDRVWHERDLAGLRELCERVQLFPAIEVTTLDGPNVLILGAVDPVYETLRTPSELLARACADGFLTVITGLASSSDELPAYCGLADAIEVRSCELAEPGQFDAVRRHAVQCNLTQLYGSDAYGLNYLNKFWIETESEFHTPQEFRRTILSGRFQNRSRGKLGVLPPCYKAATMAELTEEDAMGLVFQTTS
jgi:hypothetical protein